MQRPYTTLHYCARALGSDHCVALCRFLVHRYSVLQQHAEANGLNGDEPLETDHTPNGKIEFHNDSDEVRLSGVKALSRLVRSIPDYVPPD